MFKHTIIQQEMLKITVLIKQGKCFLIVQIEIVDFFSEFFGQNWKTWQNNQTLQKSAEINFTSQYNWPHLEHVLCIFVYFFL